MRASISLRRYLSYQLGLVIALQSVLVALLTWYVLLPHMRTDIGFRHQAFAQAIAGQVTAHMIGGQRQLRALADFIEIQGRRSASYWSEVLDSQCGNGDFFEAIYLTDYQNETINSIGLARQSRSKREDLMGFDLSGRDFLSRAQKRNRAVWSQPFLSTASSRWAVAVTVPLNQGAIVGEITIDQLHGLIGDLPLSPGLFFIILDPGGSVVADSQRRYGGQQFDIRKLPGAGHSGNESFSASKFKLDGQQLIGTVAEVDQLGWKVLVAQSYQSAFQSILSTFYIIVIGLLMALLVGGGVVWLQSGKLTQLFRLFEQKVHSIAEGQYDLPWPQVKTIEFEAFSHSLQQMALKISQREGQIIEHENHLSITLDAIGDAVITTDVHSVITRMNSSAERLTGWPSVEAVGRQLSEVFHISHARQEVVDPVQKVLAQGEIVELTNPTVLIDREGREYKIANSAAPLRKADGSIIGVVLVFRDVTEIYAQQQAIRESEERFKEIFMNAPVMALICDDRKGEPYIQDANNLFLKLTGYSRQEVINTPVYQYYTDESRKKFIDRRNGYQRLLSGEFTAVERSFITKDGRTLYTLLDARPEMDAHGRVVSSLAMFVDITERKHAEQEAERLGAALLQAQKMEAIGTLAGGIAHDFNNILSAVIGYTELALLKTEKNESIHRNLEQIFTAGMRAKDLVHQILAFSRQDERQLKPLQLAPLIKEALKLLRSSLPSTIEIKQTISTDLDNVMADPTQIHQIVMNLCTNASQAMEENGGCLTVGLSEVTLNETDVCFHPGMRPGAYIKLMVQDTGHGVPAQSLNKIFNPYFTTKGKGKGTGLGLSVVHGIVQNCGGAIDVDSTPGIGSTFSVYFPAIKLPELPVNPPQAALPTGNEHILLVDDEPILLDVGQMILQGLGYRVTTCHSGFEALEVMKSDARDIDLVISDMTMPKMTGDKLAAALLETHPELPIILCTGFSSKISDDKAVEMGVKALAMKPLAQNDLAFLVRSVLDESKAG